VNISPDIQKCLKSQKKVTLGFSTGKDSLACAVILRNLNIEYIPIYFYQCPELEFIENNIKMYEKLLGIKVVRLPHPMLYDYLRHQDFQPPKMIQFLVDQRLPHLSFEDLIFVYLDSIGEKTDYFDVVGMRSSESFNRRKFFEKYGGINEKDKKIYPIYDWKKQDIYEFLKLNHIPLTDDYKIWNRSYDGMKYQFIFGLKKHYPNDYKTLCEYFPLIETELFRYEQNKKYFE
jgi:hypothetical protein